MKILGIETSCDETAIAVVEDGQKLLAWAMASSAEMHTKTGGIIPEHAAREQIRAIIPVVDEALAQLQSATGSPEVDAIAVTYGPGLIGSLLIGVETAKTLAWVWHKPLVPTDHIIGHVYANFIGDTKPVFPYLALVVSGGHTELLLFKDHGTMQYVGGTRDDAVGEAFDKVARILGMPYPGGPAISEAARSGDPKRFLITRPMLHSGDYDFSFSGLKAAMARLAHEQPDLAAVRNDLAASFQAAAVDVLVSKTVKAAKEFAPKMVLLGGGAAANSLLRKQLVEASPVPVLMPEMRLCTDNGAMIASAAYYNYTPIPWKNINANPGLSVENVL